MQIKNAFAAHISEHDLDEKRIWVWEYFNGNVKIEPFKTKKERTEWKMRNWISDTTGHYKRFKIEKTE